MSQRMMSLFRHIGYVSCSHHMLLYCLLFRSMGSTRAARQPLGLVALCLVLHRSGHKTPGCCAGARLLYLSRCRVQVTVAPAHPAPSQVTLPAEVSWTILPEHRVLEHALHIRSKADDSGGKARESWASRHTHSMAIPWRGDADGPPGAIALCSSSTTPTRPLLGEGMKGAGRRKAVRPVRPNVGV